MACFSPLAATQLASGEILIHKRTPGLPTRTTPAHLGRDLKLPCGKCIGCRLNHTKNWAIRCLHESQLNTKNAFVTLTIDPLLGLRSAEYPHQDMWIPAKSARKFYTAAPNGEEGPNIATVHNLRSEVRAELEGSLNIKTHQKFLKRLRQRISEPIRFYMCGEYGKNLTHPHYHYLIFGYDFTDKYYWKTSKSGEKLYRSPLLEDAWPYGHAWIGNVTYDSCAYVAAYVMKKINGPQADDHYRKTDEAGNDYWIQREFALMSRGGRTGKGLSAEWFSKFTDDVYNTDKVTTHSGTHKPPRYYDKLLKDLDPSRFAEIQFNRECRARHLEHDNTPFRLHTKEKVTLAKLKLKQRRLETET